MTTLYFTATGNSLAVAKYIGGELVSIPQAVAEGRYEFEDDMVGLVFPVYCCVAPKMVREFITKVKIKANYIFAVATYGNGDGNVLKDLAARAQQIKFDYMTTIIMVDNYLPNFEIGKQIEGLPKKKVNEHITRITNDIAVKKQYIKPPQKGAKLAEILCAPLIKSQDKGLAAKKFIIDDHCTKCSTCAKVCLAGNISVTDTVDFAEKCESCYACIHLCPQGAIHLKNERSSKRWRNPEVTLKEIINSNKYEKRL